MGRGRDVPPPVDPAAIIVVVVIFIVVVVFVDQAAALSCVSRDLGDAVPEGWEARVHDLLLWYT